MLSADLSRSRNRQWTQELRLQSSYDGPLNFNIGANYLDFKSQDDYFVYNNLFTLIAQYNFNGENEGGDITRRSEEHTSELQSLMRISYAVFCLKKKNKTNHTR